MTDTKLINYISQIRRIKIELTNLCNAKCKFCAYENMQRNKNTMGEEVFKRSVDQIALIGCQILMLSPVVGDPLLDKKLPQRLGYIDAFSTIRKKHFFTNLIGLKRFSDKEIVGVLEKTDLIIISIAPNKMVYEKLFGVDKFNEVVHSIERICNLIPFCRKVPKINFAGRTNGNFSVDSRLLNLIEKTGGSSNNIWSSEYANWGGNLTEKKGLVIKHEDRAGCSLIPCERALVPVIFYDGRVGLCACADYEARFIIGDVKHQELSEILSNNQRVRLIRSFLKGSMPEYCAKCTFYVCDTNVAFWRSLEA